MKRTHQMSSLRMTVLVVADNGKIIEAAPVVRSFVGQPVGNLIRWMERQGGFRWCELEVTR